MQPVQKVSLEPCTVSLHLLFKIPSMSMVITANHCILRFKPVFKYGCQLKEIAVCSYTFKKRVQKPSLGQYFFTLEKTPVINKVIFTEQSNTVVTLIMIGFTHTHKLTMFDTGLHAVV